MYANLALPAVLESARVGTPMQTLCPVADQVVAENSQLAPFKRTNVATQQLHGVGLPQRRSISRRILTKVVVHVDELREA